MRRLPLELPSVDLAIAKLPPKALLGGGLLAPKSACEVGETLAHTIELNKAPSP